MKIIYKFLAVLGLVLLAILVGVPFAGAKEAVKIAPNRASASAPAAIEPKICQTPAWRIARGIMQEGYIVETTQADISRLGKAFMNRNNSRQEDYVFSFKHVRSKISMSFIADNGVCELITLKLE